MSDNLNCGICKQLFREPKVLPSCGHTFCLHCLQDQARHSGNQLRKCAECRRDCNVANVDSLPTNYSLKALADQARANPSASSGQSDASFSNLVQSAVSAALSSLSMGESTSSSGSNNGFTIFVRELNDRVHQFKNVQAEWTVQTLKKKLSDYYGIPAEYLRLDFMAQRLDNDKTLSFYKIRAGDTINFLGRQKGGGA